MPRAFAAPITCGAFSRKRKRSSRRRSLRRAASALIKLAKGQGSPHGAAILPCSPDLLTCPVIFAADVGPAVLRRARFQAGFGPRLIFSTLPDKHGAAPLQSGSVTTSRVPLVATGWAPQSERP